MKHILISTVLVLVTFIGVQAQSLNEVLEKYYKANGLEKLADVKTYYIKAKMNMMGMEFPMEIKVKKPNKFRVEVEAMGIKTTSAFDGEKGWMKNPMMGSGIKELKGEQLKQAMSQADLEGELYNYKAKGSEIEMLGKVDLDDTKAYKLKLTDKDKAVKYYFIDTKSFLIKKVEANLSAEGKEISVETKMSEYQEINGIKLPKTIEIKTSMGNQTVIMEEIKLDCSINDSIFEKPEK